MQHQFSGSGLDPADNNNVSHDLDFPQIVFGSSSEGL